MATTVTFTNSGHTSLRAARERPAAPILSITPHVDTARRLALVWGVHSVQVQDVTALPEMVEQARAMVRRESLASPGDTIVITAGLPFGAAGTTNLLHVAQA